MYITVSYYKNRNIPKIDKSDAWIESPRDDGGAVVTTDVEEVDVVVSAIAVVVLSLVALTIRHPFLIRGPYLLRDC